MPELSVQSVIYLTSLALPPGGRKSPMSISGTMKTLAFCRSAPRKVGQDARAFRAVGHLHDTTRTATRRQEVANEHQRDDENLGFSSFRPKESRTGCPSFPCSRSST